MNVRNQQAALEKEQAALRKELTALHDELAHLEAAPLPQVIASYATYLRARTHAAPEATVTGDHAELALTVEDKSLRLEFECRTREWSLRTAEVRDGEQATAFSRGRLADAVTALLRP